MKSDSSGAYIRDPAVAGPGGFYPSNPKQLAALINTYLEAAKESPGEAPFGLIAPHAGYVYSGPVAGWAYRQVMGRHYDAVVVLAPSHREPFSFASVMPGGIYRTPLGDVSVSAELARELVAASGSVAKLSLQGHKVSGPYAGEHSLEVQLPFLQVTIGKFNLVPVVVGWGSWELCHHLGEGIAAIAHNRSILVVASSDLSHYHSYDEAYKRDQRVIDRIAAFDARGVAEGCQAGELEACGGLPIAALLAAIGDDKAGSVKVLNHATSGDVPEGSRDQVVGYLAAALFRQTAPTKSQRERKSASRPHNSEVAESGSSGSGLALTPDEKKALLEAARGAIAASLGAGEQAPVAATGNLAEMRGLFVTLHHKGRLRGCIGHLSATEPLGVMVREVAVGSAFSDPRFPPLQRGELDGLEIEITVLGDMRPVSDPESVVVGRDGLLIRKGWLQGLLLPQVPVEQGWDRNQFLDAVCRKAGLPPGAWKQKGAELMAFSADVISEEIAR